MILPKVSIEPRFGDPVPELFFCIPDLSVTLISIHLLHQSSPWLCFFAIVLRRNWDATKEERLLLLSCSLFYFGWWVVFSQHHLSIAGGLGSDSRAQEPLSHSNEILGLLHWTAPLLHAVLHLAWCRSGCQHWKKPFHQEVVWIGSRSTLTHSCYQIQSDPSSCEAENTVQ